MEAYNAQPDGLRIPAEFGLSADDELALRDELWLRITLGEVDDLVEFVVDSENGLDRDQAEQIVSQFLAARRAQQSRHTPPPGRLTAAFAELNRVGVVARENFMCCGTCLVADIGDEVPADGGPWFGYVAYHAQDAERLIEDGATYLSYGVFPAAYLSRAEVERMSESERETWYADTVRSLMRERAFPVLEAHGMTVDWDGNLGARILLGNADFYAPLDV